MKRRAAEALAVCMLGGSGLFTALVISPSAAADVNRAERRTGKEVRQQHQASGGWLASVVL